MNLGAVLRSALLCGGFAAALATGGPAEVQADPVAAWARFSPPRAVTIQGYGGDAMEPSLSRDGQVLVFNNRNDPPEQTDLHWARRIDDLTFHYEGLVAGANSGDLDGVGTLTSGDRFCFISTRDWRQTLGTVFCSAWREGRAEPPILQAAASPRIPGRLVFDLEQAADGQTAILADGRFEGGAAPASADLRLARWIGGQYRLSPADDRLFAAVNTPGLEYAPALSADGLTLAFTRLSGRPPFARIGLWIARRPTSDAPFGAPVRIAAATGFVEGPTFSPDGRSVYFHRRIGNRFSIWRVTLSSTARTGR